ncbi:MAG: prepilin peptidase [Candidatus Paceibacterota bacterium]
MNPLTLIFLFIFGAILGSGLNALAWRVETAQSWKTGRSKCPYCSHLLSWWELVPLLSFLILRGRCHKCSQSISLQYPLVELAAAGLTTLSFLTFGFTVGGVVAFLISLLLLFIYVYDGRRMLIPDLAVWSFNLVAFAALFLSADYSLLFGGSLFTLPTWWQLAAGPILALPFLLLWLGSRGRAMGFGDVELTLGIGWLLGVSLGFSAVFYAFWIGAVVSLGLLAYQKMWKVSSSKSGDGRIISTQPEEQDRLTLKSAVPFGPFLILGFLIAFFGNVTLF